MDIGQLGHSNRPGAVLQRARAGAVGLRCAMDAGRPAAAHLACGLSAAPGLGERLGPARRFRVAPPRGRAIALSTCDADCPRDAAHLVALGNWHGDRGHRDAARWVGAGLLEDQAQAHSRPAQYLWWPTGCAPLDGGRLSGPGACHRQRPAGVGCCSMEGWLGSGWVWPVVSAGAAETVYRTIGVYLGLVASARAGGSRSLI